MRTNRQTRLYIAEIVSIHQQLTSLNMRKRAVARKLGYGTWRSRDLPGIAVVCSRGSGGWVVQWKSVAQVLADRLKLSAQELLRETYVFRSNRHATPNVSVRTNTAKLTNPKLKVY